MLQRGRQEPLEFGRFVGQLAEQGGDGDPYGLETGESHGCADVLFTGMMAAVRLSPV